MTGFITFVCIGVLPGVWSKTILETATEAGSFTTLAAALAKANLIETLNGPGPFTVFAPTDDAFAGLLAKLETTADVLLAREDLGGILKAHVAAGRIFSSSLAKGALVQTVEGVRFEANSVKGVVTLGSASVAIADLNCSNGVIHAIDSVLLPPDRLRLAGGSSWDENKWRTQVDGVMGGKSTASISFEGGAMVFSGVINLDGGGFSQAMKAFDAKDLSTHAGLMVEIDAQPYKQGIAPLGLHLEVHTSGRRSGKVAAFALPLSETPEQRVKLFIPMSSFDRSSSRWSGGGGGWDPTRVTGLQFSVLFQGGPFMVRLRKISAVQRALDAPFISAPVVALDSAAAITELIQAAINSGAVLYDKGYKELCIAQYTSATRTILTASGISAATRGIACATLVRAAQGQSASKAERAWVLRRGFDALLMDLTGKARVADARYPENVLGAWLPGPGNAGVQPGACAALQDIDTTGYAGKDKSSNSMNNMCTETSGNAVGFEGPFVGMGISGNNDFALARVSCPEECARKCRSRSSCRSFDYGARGSVVGECWMSLATRASAGAAYSKWRLYDYYEVDGSEVSGSEVSGRAGDGKSMDVNSTETSELSPWFWALLGAVVVICFCTSLLIALMCHSWKSKHNNSGHIAAADIALGNTGGDMVVGKPVVVVAPVDKGVLPMHEEKALGA